MFHPDKFCPRECEHRIVVETDQETFYECKAPEDWHCPKTGHLPVMQALQAVATSHGYEVKKISIEHVDTDEGQVRILTMAATMDVLIPEDDGQNVQQGE